MEDDGRWTCEKCKDAFGDLPEKFRPRCDKLSENLTCPKGVPMLLTVNGDAYAAYRILLTQSVDSNTGLLKADPVLIRALGDLLGVAESEQLELFAKVLLLAETSNELRLSEAAEKRQSLETKRELGELKASHQAKQAETDK